MLTGGLTFNERGIENEVHPIIQDLVKEFVNIRHSINVSPPPELQNELHQVLRSIKTRLDGLVKEDLNQLERFLREAAIAFANSENEAMKMAETCINMLAINNRKNGLVRKTEDYKDNFKVLINGKEGTLLDLVTQVIRGDHGSGSNRIERLESLGLTSEQIEEVQRQVNINVREGTTSLTGSRAVQIHSNENTERLFLGSFSQTKEIHEGLHERLKRSDSNKNVATNININHQNLSQNIRLTPASAEAIKNNHEKMHQNANINNSNLNQNIKGGNQTKEIHEKHREMHLNTNINTRNLNQNINNNLNQNIKPTEINTSRPPMGPSPTIIEQFSSNQSTSVAQKYNPSKPTSKQDIRPEFGGVGNTNPINITSPSKQDIKPTPLTGDEYRRERFENERLPGESLGEWELRVDINGDGSNG